MAAKKKSSRKKSTKTDDVSVELAAAKAAIKKLKSAVAKLEKSVAKSEKKLSDLKGDLKKVRGVAKKSAKGVVKSVKKAVPSVEPTEVPVEESLATEVVVVEDASQSELSVAQLRAVAREQKIAGYSRMRKDELAAALKG